LVEQLTLNQRVQGSSPCAPTKPFKDLAAVGIFIPTTRPGVIPTKWLLLFFERAQEPQLSRLHLDFNGFFASVEH
jgi:hypothetical protein